MRLLASTLLSLVVAGASAGDLFTQGVAASGAGDLTRAREAFTAAVAASPTFGLAHVELAETLTALGDDDVALDRALFDAQRLEPANPRVWRLSGLRAEALGRPDVAATAYARAVELRSDDARSRLRLASVLTALGRHAESKAQLELLLATDPEDRSARLLLADVLLALGQPAEALVQLETLVAQQPGNRLYAARLQALKVKQGLAVDVPAPRPKRMRELPRSRR